MGIKRHYLEVTPVDLNVDGRAEVFIQHGFYEEWGISLFHYEGGRLIKRLGVRRRRVVIHPKTLLYCGGQKAGQSLLPRRIK